MNDDAEEKALEAIITDTESGNASIQDVTGEFRELTDENQVFCITSESIGESVVTLQAVDHPETARSFTVKVIPYDEWIVDGDGNRMHYTQDQLDTGLTGIGTVYYYFGTDGIMRTDWQKVSKKWYYFGTDGIMRTGWKKIGKNWYFFSSGAMKTGWLRSGGKWYYFNKDGEMVTGSVKIGTKTYSFSSSGVCLNP